MIVPDDNEKLSINEKQDILLVLPVKVVSIRKTFATSYRVCFLLEFEATSHNAMFVGRVAVLFRRGVTQFTYRLNEYHSTQ